MAGSELWYWVGDAASIRYCNESRVVLVAGGVRSGDEDCTYGPSARFNGVWSMVYRQMSKQLIVCDAWNLRLRTVEVDNSGYVETFVGSSGGVLCDGTGLSENTANVARFGTPRMVVFDRSPNVEPESAIYITTLTHIRRYDFTSYLMTPSRLTARSTDLNRMHWTASPLVSSSFHVSTKIAFIYCNRKPVRSSD